MRLEQDRENVENSKNNDLDWEMMAGGVLAQKTITVLLNGWWWLWNGCFCVDSAYPHFVKGGLCWPDTAKISDLLIYQFHVFFPLSLFLLPLRSCNSHEEVLFLSKFFLETAALLWPLLFFWTTVEFNSHQGVKSMSGSLVLKGSTCYWVFPLMFKHLI